MNKNQSAILSKVIRLTIDQLDQFLKSLSKISKPKEITKTQAIILERIYLNLFGVEVLQEKIEHIPQVKISLFVTMRAIISDMLTGFFFDRFHENTELVTRINNLHTREYLQFIEFIIKNELDFFPKISEKEKIIKINQELEKLRKEYTSFYKKEKSDFKIKSAKELFGDFSLWPFDKNTSISDTQKFESLKYIDKESPLHNLKSHFIYIAYRIFSQYQHYSMNSENQLLPFDKQDLDIYRKVFIFLMMFIEQVSSNITEANSKEIEDLRKIVQQNAKALIHDFKE
jgi:hypothetical protein